MVLLAASGACSDGTLSRDRAASLITSVEGFSREARFTIQTGAPLQSAFKCLSQAEVERSPVNQFMVQRGWVRFGAREANVGFGTKATCPALELTPEGQAASAQWTGGRAASGQGTAWAVPIARRELVAVTGLTTGQNESTQVEFDWKWTSNETGAALRKSVPKANAFFDQVRKGRASCRRWDDGWRCQLAMWRTPADVGEFQPED